MLSSALRWSMKAVLMMLCVVYAGSALKSAWAMAMTRIVVLMPRYTYCVWIWFSNYKFSCYGLSTVKQAKHGSNFTQLLFLHFSVVHINHDSFSLFVLFLTLKYTVHNVTPYSLNLFNFNFRVDLVLTYIITVSKCIKNIDLARAKSEAPDNIYSLLKQNVKSCYAKQWGQRELIRVEV